MTVFPRDRELLDSFRRGERDALTAVYRRYVDQVAVLVRRGFLVGSGGAVRGIREHDRQADLVQEVFVRAFSAQARSSFDGVSPYGPYLLRIAKNLMIDEARRAGRMAPAEAGRSALDEAAGVEPFSPEDDLEWRRLREATRAFCSTLSEGLRRFVQLRFEEGRSQRDVAEARQVSRRRARTWEQEGRDGLRRHLRRPAERPAPRPHPSITQGQPARPSAGPEGRFRDQGGS